MYIYHTTLIIQFQVEILVTNGAKLGARDVADRAALHFAASAPNVEILRYLIDAGADVNCEDGLGSTLGIRLFSFEHFSLLFLREKISKCMFPEMSFCCI